MRSRLPSVKPFWQDWTYHPLGVTMAKLFAVGFYDMAVNYRILEAAVIVRAESAEAAIAAASTHPACEQGLKCGALAAEELPFIDEELEARLGRRAEARRADLRRIG